MSELWKAHRRWASPFTYGGDARTVSTAFSPNHDAVGWNMPTLASSDTAGRSAAWARFSATGARLARCDAYWPSLQPTNVGNAGPGLNDTIDSAQWANLDAFVDDAEAVGAFVWMSAGYTPTWARPSTTSLPGYVTWGQSDHVPPEREPENQFPDFANFCWLVADHYATRNPGRVVAIGVWNEPNIAQFWMQPPGSGTQPNVDYTPDAGIYAKVLQGAFDAVKTGTVLGRSARAAHPEILVLTGGTSPAGGSGNGSDYLPKTFVHTVLAAAPTAFDHLDHHPYCWQGGPGEAASWNAFAQMHDLWAELVAVGREDALIWCSEIGAVSRPDDSGTDPASPYANGGYNSAAPATTYITWSGAIDYTTAAVRVAEMFIAWRSADFYDTTFLKHILGPMCWYEMFDHAAGIHSTWPLDSGGRRWYDYYGFYEYGSTRWDGAAKGAMLTIWEYYAAPDVTPPMNAAVILPHEGDTLAGPNVSVGVIGSDDRDQYIEQVFVTVDGVVVGQATPYLGYIFNWDSQSVANGPHTLGAILVDNVGNKTATGTVNVTVSNVATQADNGVDYEISDPWRILVRDATYQRVAQVSGIAELNIKLPLNDLGGWTLTAPYDDAYVGYLLRPGAGIVVTKNGEVVASGPVTETDHEWSHGKDIVTISGITDEAVLSWRTAHPAPALASTLGDDTWGVEADVQTMRAEDLLVYYVNVNAGPGAVAARQTPGFRVPISGGRGPSVTGRAHMQELLALIKEIADLGGLIYSVTADDFGPVMAVGVPRDLTASVRFSPEFGNLRSFGHLLARPTWNHGYVGGSGSGAARVYVEVENAASVTRWGRIEGSADARNGDTLGELRDSGNAALMESASTEGFKVEPIDFAGTQFPEDYGLGDIVAIVADGVVISDTIRAVEISLSSSGVTVQPTIGDQVIQRVSMNQAAKRLHDRMQKLETSS